MANRIRRIEVTDRSLDPVSADIWISVLSEHQTATTEIRGRLMGPRCPYSSTVEVAYPLRALSSVPKTPEGTGLTVRAVIPEASLWEPQCPFLYHGPIQLWQDGVCCDQVILNHGLRSLRRTQHGLFVNGRQLTLRGQRIDSCSDEEATRWHQIGYNLLIAPVTVTCRAIWEQADRFGFLVLGQLVKDAGEPHLVDMLRSHSSCLGWLGPECRELNAEQAIERYMAHGNPGAT